MKLRGTHLQAFGQHLANIWPTFGNIDQQDLQHLIWLISATAGQNVGEHIARFYEHFEFGAMPNKNVGHLVEIEKLCR